MKNIELISETIRNLTECARRRFVPSVVLDLVIPELEKSFSAVSAGGGRGQRVRVLKYMHTANPTKTWSGRGRKPNWLKLAEVSGIKINEFLVKNELRGVGQ